MGRLWVLGLLLAAYMLNQLDRYLPVVTSKEMEQALDFGDGEGGGLAYQLLVGPAFTLLFSVGGVAVGHVAPRVRTERLLAALLLAWSAATALMGAAGSYAALLAARSLQGFAESGCTPLSNALISDHFPPAQLGTALGVYNIAIYAGLSATLGAGQAVKIACGWRAVYYLGAAAGVPVALLIAGTVRRTSAQPSAAGSGVEPAAAVGDVLRHWLRCRPLLLLALASGLRNAAGYVWAYNQVLFYNDTMGLTDSYIASFLGWIPVVAGSIGAVLGGFVSDRVVKRGPLARRLVVLVGSQLLAAPFCVGALWLPAPWCFLSLVPAYAIGEAWVGVALAVLVELVPPRMRVLSVSFYFFVISNLGGLAPSLEPTLSDVVGQRWAIALLYPGLYVAGACVFGLTGLALARPGGGGGAASEPLLSGASAASVASGVSDLEVPRLSVSRSGRSAAASALLDGDTRWDQGRLASDVSMMTDVAM